MAPSAPPFRSSIFTTIRMRIKINKNKRPLVLVLLRFIRGDPWFFTTESSFPIPRVVNIALPRVDPSLGAGSDHYGGDLALPGGRSAPHSSSLTVFPVWVHRRSSLESDSHLSNHFRCSLSLCCLLPHFQTITLLNDSGDSANSLS